MQVSSSSLTLFRYVSLLALLISPAPRYELFRDVFGCFSGVLVGSIAVQADNVLQ